MESELLRNIKPKLLILILIVSFIGASLLLTCPIYAVVIKGNKWIVASRYPEATEAAALMLQQGGNAFDAAVAGLAVLGIVDPLISGLGAEVFALVYSAEENKVISINGGGMAPKAATIEWYLKSDQNPLNTGLIPGALDVWVTMVDKWGVMKLEEVLTPAIKLAEGWKVSEALAQILANEDIKEKLSRFASSRELYYKEDGSPYLAGEVMLNQDLANTMKRIIIAEQQATAYCACRGDNHRHQAMINARDCFYKGSIAKDFGEFFKAHEIPFTYFDMVSYHALLETPAHINYRGYDIYTCPSANQGPAELEALNIMEKFNLVSLEYNTAQSIHLMAEAINLAYADREKYLGDCNFIQCPLNGLLSKEYAQKRKELVDRKQRRTEWPPGNPVPFNHPQYVYDGNFVPRYPDLPLRDVKFEREFTLHDQFSHIPENIFTQDSKDIEDILGYESTYVCAADKRGNLVYATSSLNSPFGTGVVIKPLGFPLNSGIDYFRLDPDHANALAPGKRPRTTVTPTLVCKEGRPYFAIGASNGDGEPQTLAQSLVNLIDYGMNIQEALNAPMWRSSWLPASSAPFTAESGVLSVDEQVSPATRKQLEEMGWKVQMVRAFSHNPECLLLMDHDQGTLKVVVPSHTSYSAIAW